VVKLLARLIQPQPLLYERDDKGRLVALGDPAGVTLDEVRRRLLDVLDENWKKTADVRELLEEPRPGEEIIRRALLAEAKCGAIQRDPDIDVEKVQGKTSRWRMHPTFPK
jgi:hypothetical protein